MDVHTGSVEIIFTEPPQLEAASATVLLRLFRQQLVRRGRNRSVDIIRQEDALAS